MLGKLRFFVWMHSLNLDCNHEKQKTSYNVPLNVALKFFTNCLGHEKKIRGTVPSCAIIGNNISDILPLRFRKAGRVWFGGARRLIEPRVTME